VIEKLAEMGYPPAGDAGSCTAYAICTNGDSAQP